MKQVRLEQLADGIFAIAITLLVFHLQLPALPQGSSDATILAQLVGMRASFASYLLAFAVLFTYWRAHHFIASVYAKGIDQMFTNINALFFFFVALVPFSADMLGRFSYSRIAVIVFAANIIAIGLTLLWMRSYVTHAITIENQHVSETEERHALARILVPIIMALVAIVLLPFGTTLSLVVLTLGILFNLSRRSTRLMFKAMGKE